MQVRAHGVESDEYRARSWVLGGAAEAQTIELNGAGGGWMANGRTSGRQQAGVTSAGDPVFFFHSVSILDDQARPALVIQGYSNHDRSPAEPEKDANNWDAAVTHFTGQSSA